MIAEKSGGIVYRATKDHIDEIVDVIQIKYGSDAVYLSKVSPAPKEFNFMVDKSLGSFSIDATGTVDVPEFTLIHPYGEFYKCNARVILVNFHDFLKKYLR